ncbi:MAG: hypothetical protein B7O98_04230 [Zestosphaera tikiterensis]|uniref:DUF4386 domain-containing protein n=1 Tax=Zestosphaera tikiterensis TaxID=1973259 RepID=A0A2R7Y898_9CREN|nr:MAG: hypothetical protein B7O98_04230 [Zestosphaera tikiterensis]
MFPTSGKEALGLFLTVLALAIFVYEILYVGLFIGTIGVKGSVATDAVLISFGWLLILIGPALWLGEVPTNVKKLIEAKTGRKLS